LTDLCCVINIPNGFLNKSDLMNIDRRITIIITIIITIMDMNVTSTPLLITMVY
jgi:hypothetical protein